MAKTTKKTIVGNTDARILAFTVGADTELDLLLAEADCIGSAAHVTMLSKLALPGKLFSPQQCAKLIKELVRIARLARKGSLAIKTTDQDIHMTIERMVTRKLGELGKKMHFARSRNDQIAVDLRLYAKEQLLHALNDLLGLATGLLKQAKKNTAVPMVGRTHMQPGMPSSVGLWAAAYVESLLEDASVLINAYELNDQCPLGSAAGYGVPIPIDRQLTSRLLGFKRPINNVLHAGNARGKCEAVILSAMSQVMLSLSRLATDLLLYTMPEFAYFSLPPELCTGSSIMPQKRNPDVLELVRAKTSTVLSHTSCVAGIVANLPSGYNRDLQETKRPFIEGIQITRDCLAVLTLAINKLKISKKNLLNAFHPGVFAADHAYRLVADGIPFRDAYVKTRKSLGKLPNINPVAALRQRKHLGGPARLNLGAAATQIRNVSKLVKTKQAAHHKAISKLLGVKYPAL